VILPIASLLLQGEAQPRLQFFEGEFRAQRIEDSPCKVVEQTELEQLLAEEISFIAPTRTDFRNVRVGHGWIDPYAPITVYRARSECDTRRGPFPQGAQTQDEALVALDQAALVRVPHHGGIEQGRRL
jgi:hypothetical protein